MATTEIGATKWGWRNVLRHQPEDIFDISARFHLGNQRTLPPSSSMIDIKGYQLVTRLLTNDIFYDHNVLFPVKEISIVTLRKMRNVDKKAKRNHNHIRFPAPFEKAFQSEYNLISHHACAED